MSATGPKDIVRQFLDAIAAGDGDTMLGLLADDAVMITPGSPKVPFNGRFEGKASIAQAFRIFAEFLEICDHTIKLLFGEGEHCGHDQRDLARQAHRPLHQARHVLVFPRLRRAYRLVGGLRGYGAGELGVGRCGDAPPRVSRHGHAPGAPPA